MVAVGFIKDVPLFIRFLFVHLDQNLASFRINLENFKNKIHFNFVVYDATLKMLKFLYVALETFCLPQQLFKKEGFLKEEEIE